jgi:hypothetical protein|nr:hypothetical protein [uncultured Methanoregula sp.]
MPSEETQYAANTNTPRWFTGVAIVILFATLFVGGNSWWPLVVLATIALGLILLIQTNRSARRA